MNDFFIMCLCVVGVAIVAIPIFLSILIDTLQKTNEKLGEIADQVWRQGGQK